MCSTCFAAPRVEGTAQCEFCGPGRLFDPRALTPPLDPAPPPTDDDRALVLDAGEDER